MRTPDTVIVGGGIAGLATAFYLERRAIEKGLPLPSYTLLEAGDRLGGKLVTRRVGDYVLEGGPDSFIAQKPWGMQLCRDLGIADTLVPCSSTNQKIYLLRQGRLVAFPRGLRLGVPTEFLPFVCSPLFSPLGKLRMAMELFIPRKRSDDDESVGSFMARRLGREASTRIAGPMMAGIYVSDPDRLSIQSTFPMFIDMERSHGSLIRAMLSAKRAGRKRAGPPPAMFVSPRSGMQEIVDTLVPRLQGEWRTNARVTAIQRREGGFTVTCADGSHLNPAQLVLATPAYASAELLAPLHAELAQRLRDIRYVATALVVLAYDKATFKVTVPYDGYGFMVPPGENTHLIACTWASLKFPHRSPEGCAVFRAFVGGEGHEQNAHVPDDIMVQRVREDLASIMGIKAEPVHCDLYRWPRGNPQYDVGHLDRVAAMEDLAATIPGLHLAGSTYRGIGIPDCVHAGMLTAEALLSGRAPAR